MSLISTEKHCTTRSVNAYTTVKMKGILLSTIKPQSRANNTILIFRPDKALNTSLYELTKVQTECLPANCQTIIYIA